MKIFNIFKRWKSTSTENRSAVEELETGLRMEMLQKKVKESEKHLTCKDQELALLEMQIKMKNLEMDIQTLKTEMLKEKKEKERVQMLESIDNCRRPAKNRLVMANLAQFVLAQEVGDVEAEMAVAGLMRRNYF